MEDREMKKQLLSVALLLFVANSQAMMAVIASQQKNIPTKMTVGETETIPKKLKGKITTQGPITAIQDGANLKIHMHAAGEGKIHVDGKEIATVYGAHADISTTPTHLTLGNTIHAENSDGKRFEQINGKDENAGSVNISHKNA